ncbi:Lrp/AsnC family transcriptional regulator [Haloferax sp. YSSS75]|uniref:Lrp/AsnC family transcriptional regulator n=1 Tax=Haloferax sp. YSSS75 TaxID=3388564 RepID=UPI00398D18D4
MVDVDLDDTDFEILRWLENDADTDVEELSEELGLGTSAIYYRIERYRDQGIVTSTHRQINRDELGLSLTVVSEVESEYGPGHDEIGDELRDISGVQTAYFMLGERSYILVAHLRGHDHLQKYIDEMIHTDGVSHSATHVVLETFKDEPRLLTNYDDEDLEPLES